MSIKKFMAYAFVSSLAFGTVYAQAPKAAKPAVAKPAAVKPAKPAFDAEALLKIIPDIIGEYTVDGKVVKVDTKQVKDGLREELKIAALNGQTITPEMIKRFLPRVAEQLVMEQVLPLQAAKCGFKPNLDIVRKEIAMLKKQGTEEQFKQFLKAQGCATEEDFVKKVAPRQAIQEYVKSLEAKIVIPDKDVKAFYDAHATEMKYYQCAHILAAFDAKNPRNEKITPAQEAAALKKIQDIKAKLDKGVAFEELAKSSSDCPSGKQGGVLGNYNPDTKMAPGQMVPEFTEAFNKLKPGEVTAAPVKTQFGYHLIKAGKVSVRTLAEVTPGIREQLKQEIMQKKGMALLEQVKKDFKIKFYIGK